MEFIAGVALPSHLRYSAEILRSGGFSRDITGVGFAHPELF